MSFAHPPQHLYEDLTVMQPLRQYDAPNLHFVHHHASGPGHGYNYDEQNPHHSLHAGTTAHDLYSNELHYHGASLSSLHHPDSSQQWVSYPLGNNQLNYVSDAANPVYRFPNSSYSPHHAVSSVSHAPSHSVFQNSGPLHLDMNPATLRTLAGSLDPTTGVFYRTPEHPRLRTAQACEKCRTRKAKCSGEHPSCKRCLNRGLVCEYAKEGRVRGPNKPKPKPSVITEISSHLDRCQNQSPLTSEIDCSIPSSVAAGPRTYISPSILPPSMSASLSSPSSPCSPGYEALHSPISSTSSPDSTLGSHCHLDSNSYSDSRSDKRRPSNLRLSSSYCPASEMSNVPVSYQSMSQIHAQRTYVRTPSSMNIPPSGSFPFDHAESYLGKSSNVLSADYLQKEYEGVACVPYYPRASEGSTFAEASQRPQTYTVFSHGNSQPEEGLQSKYVNLDAY